MVLIGPPEKKDNVGFIETRPATKEELKMFREFEKNSMYFFRHKEDLRPRFYGNYIAIYNCAVVDYGEDLKKLVKRLNERYDKQEYKYVAIEYLPKEDLPLILTYVAD